MTKRLLGQGTGPHYRAAENFMSAVFATKDVEEGRQPFEQRREPRFAGN